MNELYKGLVVAALLMLVQMTFYWAVKPATRGRRHHSAAVAWDARLPYVPAFSVIYLGCFLFWIASYALAARAGGELLLRVALTAVLVNMTAAVIFVVFPTEIERPEITCGGLYGFLLRVIYFFDSPVNLFPSLHCAISWLCVLAAFGAPLSLGWKLFALAFALAVFASTVLIRQHYLLDILGGWALTQLVWMLTAHTPRLLERTETLLTAAWEIFGLS